MVLLGLAFLEKATCLFKNFFTPLNSNHTTGSERNQGVAEKVQKQLKSKSSW